MYLCLALESFPEHEHLLFQGSAKLYSLICIKLLFGNLEICFKENKLQRVISCINGIILIQKQYIKLCIIN